MVVQNQVLNVLSHCLWVKSHSHLHAFTHLQGATVGSHGKRPETGVHIIREENGTSLQIYHCGEPELLKLKQESKKHTYQANISPFKENTALVPTFEFAT